MWNFKGIPNKIFYGVSSFASVMNNTQQKLILIMMLLDYRFIQITAIVLCFQHRFFVFVVLCAVLEYCVPIVLLRIEISQRVFAVAERRQNLPQNNNIHTWMFEFKLGNNSLRKRT